jgi:hypothetical protein
MLLARIFAHFFRAPKIISLQETLEKQDSPVDTLVFEVTKTSSDFRRDLMATIIPPSKPFAIYNGGYDRARERGICLRIANGGAGQTGLLRAWADAFIRDMVAKGAEPFEVSLRPSKLHRYS